MKNKSSGTLHKSLKNENRSCERVIIIIDAILLLFSAAVLVSTHGRVLDSYVYSYGTDRFMDFFNHIGYTDDLSRTYFVNYNAVFPPLAYLFYKFLNMILPAGTVVLFNSGATGSYGLLIFVVYNCIICCLIMYNVIEILKNYTGSSLSPLALSVFYFLSVPYMFGVIERGNAVGIVALLLLAAFRLRESSSKAKRELALIFIAIAAAFKIYPAVIGLLYLSDKRFKEAARLVVYGIVMFFAPFAFLGGVAGFNRFRENLIKIQELMIQGLNIGGTISVYGIFHRFFSGSGSKADTGGTVLMVIFACIFVFGIFTAKQTWEKAAFAVAVMTFVPKWSGTYTLAYYFIPLVLFVRQARCERRPANIFYAALFALLNSQILIDGTIGYTGVAAAYYIIVPAVYLLVLALAVQTAVSFVSRGRSKKRAVNS